jgi:hypothetical protein
MILDVERAIDDANSGERLTIKARVGINNQDYVY